MACKFCKTISKSVSKPVFLPVFTKKTEKNNKSRHNLILQYFFNFCNYCKKISILQRAFIAPQPKIAMATKQNF